MRENKLTKSVIASCFLAGCLEMYDFIIFGFLAPVIHKNYLSFLDSDSSLIITYALFAVGFLFRPIGSIIFGYIGDVYGRKPSLVLSVTLMGTASLGMFLLPSYELIGISSCYIIALIRILQGISVGGEYNGAAIYAIEHINKKNIGLVGATVTAGSTLGVLLATFISKVLQNPALPSYSWRFAFLIGFGLSIIGYIIRNKLRESPVFQELSARKGEIPIIEGIKSHKTEFLAAILASGANNASFYFILIFVPNFLKSKLSFNVDWIGLLMTSIMFVLIPLAGCFSDKIGRTKLVIGSCLGMAIYNLVFLNLILSAEGPGLVAIYAIICASMVSLLIGTVNVFVLEIFSARYRFSCASLSYSLGVAIFGGTTPMVLSFLGEYSGNEPLYLGAYVSSISILGALGGVLIFLKQRLKHKV
jgi:MHS family proline/betaine transporter-like MFS transporter